VWQQPERLHEYNRRLGLNCLVAPPGMGRPRRGYMTRFAQSARKHDMGAIIHYLDDMDEVPGVWGYIGGWDLERNRRVRARMRERGVKQILQVNAYSDAVLKKEDSDYYREHLRIADAVVSHVWPEELGADRRNIRMVADFVDRIRDLCKDRPGGEVSIWPDINPHPWTRREIRDREGNEVAPEMHYDAPTDEEFRFQIWVALIHGADGICIFPISFNPFVYSQIPAKKEELLMRETRRIQRFAPVFAANESPLKVKVAGEVPGGIVDFTTRRYEGKDYVFAVNGITEPQKVRLSAPGLGRTLVLTDLLKSEVRAVAGAAYEEALGGLELRIWQLAPVAPVSAAPAARAPRTEP